MALRVICRAIILDQETTRVLLVRNQKASFWYTPGGGWDGEREDLQYCVIRETEEETGIKIHPIRLLYVQEFHPGNGDIHLELFWFAYPLEGTEIPPIADHHGIVEEARWFLREDLQPLKVYPVRLKNQFWHELAGMLTSPNPLIRKE